MEFVRQVNEDGNTPIFVVRVGDATRLLKTVRPSISLDDFTCLNTVMQYPEADADRRTRPRDPCNEDEPVDPTKPLSREKEAYAHLLHAGVCAQGHVSQCYSWTELSSAHVDAMLRAAPNLVYWKVGRAEDLRQKTQEGRFPKAVVLEYFPDVQTLSLDNLTFKMAEQALRSLYAIHSAYVRHGDIRRRKMLILPGGRVVLVDFNCAMCASDRRLTRWDLYHEFQDG